MILSNFFYNWKKGFWEFEVQKKPYKWSWKTIRLQFRKVTCWFAQVAQCYYKDTELDKSIPGRNGSSDDNFITSCNIRHIFTRFESKEMLSSNLSHSLWHSDTKRSSLNLLTHQHLTLVQLNTLRWNIHSYKKKCVTYSLGKNETFLRVHCFHELYWATIVMRDAAMQRKSLEPNWPTESILARCEQTPTRVVRDMCCCIYAFYTTVTDLYEYPSWREENGEFFRVTHLSPRAQPI